MGTKRRLLVKAMFCVLLFFMADLPGVIARERTVQDPDSDILRIPPVYVAQQRTVLNLEDCYGMAERNYPLIRQYALIEKSRDYSVRSASKGYLPRLNIGGQATYQSDVTKLPFPVQNIEMPALSHDQYKIYAEISQPLTDLLTVKNNRDLVEANAEVERQTTDVEFHKLKERINQLYFGILLINAQIDQVELLKKDIRTGIDRSIVAVENGVAFKSDVDILKAELLKSDQRTIELKAVRKGYTDMLSLFINQKITDDAVFEKPAVVPLSTVINRPELNLFEKQRTVLDVRDRLITSKNIPQVNLFLQGGYGRPGLNFLSNDFDTYYMGGIRLSWNITGLYTLREERKNISVNRSMIDVQQDLFMFNTNLALSQQDSEITKLRELVGTDEEIILLRENVSLATKHQLEQGTATANDYIICLNAQDQARQNLLLHQIQLLMVQYNHKSTTGN
ncbi:TolC family protein [uncultured Proteiniphilum sp.]|uniref:TolC family protein n=1 Tax=uncultured Proteiniphilum sp. TaxID=497637 RepID=UPI0026041246|nr:TolC family protein [uncultured Proteiniphilum sp.]